MVTSHIEEDVVPQIKRSPWLDNFFRPLLITIMIMSFNISLVNLVRTFNPAWRGTYFLLGMLLTTVEALYSYRVLKLLCSRGMSVLRYRLAELVVLTLMLKILSFVDKPTVLIWAELKAMWQNPENFITIEYMILVILACIAWLAATNTMIDFEDLHDPYSFRSDRLLPLDNLAVRFFWGGIMLVFISGLTQWVSRVGFSRTLLNLQRPSLDGVIINVLIYFTVGLILLSQARLTMLLMRWRFQKIRIGSDLARQWAQYGLIFLGLVAIIAFILPTSYSLGFLASASIVILYLLNVITFLVQLILFLLSLPLLWLLSLLGQASEDALPRSPAIPPVLPESAPGDVLPVPWLEVVRSLIFWLLTIAIVWYLVKVYLHDHPELVQSFKTLRLVNLIINFLRGVWQRLLGVAQMGLDLIPKKVTLAEKEDDIAVPARRGRWFGLGGLLPQERILYYYLNILKRAEKGGPVRQKHQTPYEYESELSQAMPDAESAVKLLTQTFVRARYSQDSFNDTQANLAKVLWRQIRRELQGISKRPKREANQ